MTKGYKFGQSYYKKKIQPEFSAPWYKPHTEWPNIPLKIYKLPEYYSFDLQQVQVEITTLLDKFGTSHDQNADYSGLSLTAMQDADNPLEDWHVRRRKDNSRMSHSVMYKNRELPDFVERPYEIETNAMTPLVKTIAAKFKSAITKVNLVKLDAGGAIVPHLDFPYYQGIRLHASIFTNDQMYYDIENERFNIPADGNFYFFNAGKHHGVINQGQTDRINLNINLQLDVELLRKFGLQYLIDNQLL